MDGAPIPTVMAPRIKSAGRLAILAVCPSTCAAIDGRHRAGHDEGVGARAAFAQGDTIACPQLACSQCL